MGAKILDQKQALASFFDSLMHDVESYAESEQTDQTPANPVAAEKDNNQRQTERVVSLQTVEKPVLIKEETRTVFESLPPVAPPKEEINTAVVVETKTESEPAKLGKPDWADEEFQAMLFKVAGLTLAVPLVELHGIVEWKKDNITTMPGHADFYLGLMSHLGKKIPLVDTARLVLPPNKLTKLAGNDPQARITRVVLINDSQYGLACDEVDEVITLKPDEVRWRTERTQRRWLAGTVVEHMCALLDAKAFAELLASRAPVDEFRE